jgi:energy-coupling factor transporter ATP-binding protein EcfA2
MMRTVTRTSYRRAQEALERDKESLARAEKDEFAKLQAREIIQATGQAVQEQAHSQIAAVVTKCLHAVYGPEAYDFKIEFVRKRGKTEAQMSFWREGRKVNPLRAAGGGVVDVAAFALRIACLMLTKPPVRRLVILDEPMKFVSKDKHARVVELIETLSKELDIQFIIVSHDLEFQVGKVIRIGVDK